MTGRSTDADLRFVVQEHYARRHHFDLRLERDGVLWSWAVPKGPPDKPGVRRLAVRVDDHDLSHLDHEDPTPVPGVAGAIRKRIWDHGTYRTIRVSEAKWVFELSGQRLTGRYVLIHTGEASWLMQRMATAPARSP